MLYRDDIGNHHACYDLSDRFVDIGYEVKYEWRDRKLILEANLTIFPYFLAWEYVRGQKFSSESSLFSKNRVFDVKIRDLSQSRIEASLDKVIAWAKTQDIEQKLYQEATNGSAKSSTIAKAVLGDIETLKSYKPTPKLDVPEFSDYKTTTWVERILLFARAYKNRELDDILARKMPQKQLMSLTAATNIFKSHGWFAKEPGKMWLALPDRFVKFHFRLWNLNDKQNIYINAITSTEEISRACRYIHYGRDYRFIRPENIYQTFNSLGNGLNICLDTLTERELIKISERVIQWARAQNFEAELKSRAPIQTYLQASSSCQNMIWHLACLALTGKIEALKSYQNTLASDKIAQYSTDRSMFSCVDRAVEFAEEHLTVSYSRKKANLRQRIISYFMSSSLLHQMMIKPFFPITKAFLHVNSWIWTKAPMGSILSVLRLWTIKSQSEQKVEGVRIGSQDLVVLNTITEQLETMGWTIYCDKECNYNAYFIGKDRLINIVYHSDTKGKKPIIIFKASLSTLSFSTAYRDIFPTRSQYTSIKEAEDIYTVSYISIDESKLKQICECILNWAHQQNVQQVISDYAALPTDSDIELVERHLIALVLIGDTKKLKFYKESFRTGDHLGFAVEITKDLVNRVLTLTRRYRLGLLKSASLLTFDSETVPLKAKEETFLTMESTIALFKSLGWLVHGIEGKENLLAIYQLPDREVQILYNDEITKDCPEFDIGFSITTGILSSICRTIDPINSQNLPDLQLYFNKKGLKIVEEKISASRLELELDDTLEWAMENIDIHRLFRCRYGIPPWKTSKTSETDDVHYGLLHIGALALLGDVETLQFYHRSFGGGDHLGFDESIHQIHLECAVVLAKEIAKVKQLSYALIEEIAKNFLTN